GPLALHSFPTRRSSDLLFNRVAGTQFRVVAGYKGASVMFQALEQKEIDVVPASWVAVAVSHADKLKSGEYIPIFAIALDRMPELDRKSTRLNSSHVKNL